MPFLGKLKVVEYDYRSWALLEDLVYQGQTDRYVVPAGYVTDYATVPESFLWLIYKTGPYTRASVVHDYLITDGIPAGTISSRDTDGIFRRIMREEGTPFARRWVMWTAVRWGALFSKKRAAGRQFYKDAPLVLLISLLALIPVGVPTIPVFIMRTLLRPLR